MPDAPPELQSSLRVIQLLQIATVWPTRSGDDGKMSRLEKRRCWWKRCQMLERGLGDYCGQQSIRFGMLTAAIRCLAHALHCQPSNKYLLPSSGAILPKGRHPAHFSNA